MEQHQTSLEKLCRLCGNKVVLRKGYLNAKLCIEYKDIFQNKFGILLPEDPTIYPQKLCNSCKNRVNYIVHKQKDYANPSETVVFEPHNELNCSICALNTARKSKGTLTVKDLDNHFKSYGFIKMLPQTGHRVYCLTDVNKLNPNITITVRVHENFTWDIYALDKLMNTNLACVNLPLILDEQNVKLFCETVMAFKICTGNQDFPEVLADRVDFKEPFPSSDASERIAYAESSQGNTPLIKDKFDTIRSSECLYVVVADIGLCEKCKVVRKNLSKYKARASEKGESRDDRTSSASTTNIKTLKIEELELRLKNAQISKRQALNQLARTSKKLETLLKKESVNPKKLTKSQHELFKKIIKEKMPSFEEGSPQWLLWKQQGEQASKADSRGMRWHPLIIRWCLSIYSISPAAYRQIASKQNNFLVLPHVNTLKKYINFTTPSNGFSVEIISKIVEENNLHEIDEFQKNVCLSFDEIRIKSGLVYKRSTGKVVGFTEMGKLNEEIKTLTNSLDQKESSDETSNIASYVIVFMIRGLFSKLCVPIGYFPSTGFRGEELCPLVLEATRIMEALTFKVRSWTSDGATPNRKLYQIISTGEPFYYTTNVFNNMRNIYFISDPPHLLKTLRNNLENSHGNLKSRNLICNQKEISWMHIVDVYEWDLGLNTAALGIRMLHKLKEEHIRLTPQHRMSVKYAAQVISNSVAQALRSQNRPGTEETIKFIEVFDKAFDCLNVTRIKKGEKPYRQPYRRVDDQRFEFLQTVITYLEEWEDEIESIVGLTRDEQSRLLLSHQTVFGWKLTITSFVELVKKLLNEAGPGTFILSEKFSQDPLEEHFSRHRRIAGCNDNPTLAQFQQQEVSLHAMSSNLIADLRGNTRGRQTDRVQLNVNDLRLPRKRPLKK